MKAFHWQEFKPTIFFLSKFLGIYLTGNLLYGIYITSNYPQPDPVTHLVSGQVSTMINACGWPVYEKDSVQKPTTLIIYKDHSVLSVFEGCNGINTMIIFVAFLLAFGPYSKKMLWFLPLGLVVIHITNLLRIILLFFVAEFRPALMYFTHKYLFTAAIYAVILVLWVIWVKKFALRK
jgi:exosortase family protein XrtF